MKKLSLLSVSFVFVIALLFSGCAGLLKSSHPRKILLRYKLVPHESQKYKTVLSGSGETEILKKERAAFKRKVNFTQSLFYTQTPTTKSGEFYRMELKYDDIAIDVTIDGKKKPNITNNMKVSKQVLIDRPIYFFKSERGATKDIEGFNNLVREFMRKKPIGDEQDMVVSTGISRSIGQFIQRVVSQNIRSFPVDPVEVGYGWKDEVIQDVPFMGKIKSTYTGKLVGFTKIKGTLCAKIKYTHSMKTLADSKDKSFGNISFIQKIEGSGYHYFSVEGDRTAYLLKTTGNVTSDIEMNREVMTEAGEKEPVRNISSMRLKTTLELL